MSDQEVRWCPGCGDYSILAQTQKVMPDFGYPRENIVFISGIGCSGPPAVLHEHVRLPLDPRPGADARDRPEGGPAGPDGLGHHRRRRRAVDRRQPRPPLDAPQRRHQHGHVQQPDLRPDQGPGVADLRVRQAHQVDAGRHGRHADHAADDRPGRRGELRGALGRHPHRAPPEDARAVRPAPRLVLRRGPPELQHLQRRRLARLHRSRGPRGPDAHPRARQADDLRQGPRQGDPPERAAAGGRHDRRERDHRGRPPRPRRAGRGAVPRPDAVADVLAGLPGAGRRPARGLPPDPRPADRGPADRRGGARAAWATSSRCSTAAKPGRSTRPEGRKESSHALSGLWLRQPDRGRGLRQLRRGPGRPRHPAAGALLPGSPARRAPRRARRPAAVDGRSGHPGRRGDRPDAGRRSRTSCWSPWTTGWSASSPTATRS